MSLLQTIRSKLGREARYLGRDFAHFTGLDDDLYHNARGSRILIYHGICLKDHTRFNPIFLRLKTFEHHLQFYKTYFNVLSLDDFYRGNLNEEKFNVCITFDDGYANNYKYVLSLLHKYQLPATFFVTAIREAGYDILWNDFLNIVGRYGPQKLVYKDEQFYKGPFNKYISVKSGTSMVEMLRSGGFEVKAEMMNLLYPVVPYKQTRSDDEEYWLQMTRQQIKALSASPLAGIGAHGYYHNDLARMDIRDAAGEMIRCKQYLENTIGGPVNSLAFPYGTYTRGVVSAAKDAGYNQLLCMDFHYNEDHADPTMKERFTVNPFISTPNQMRATITRKYD
jgi:peptidoglycan/xylan/chitin deacetylase (PgdA/CDA1 family)